MKYLALEALHQNLYVIHKLPNETAQLYHCHKHICGVLIVIAVEPFINGVLNVNVFTALLLSSM